MRQFYLKLLEEQLRWIKSCGDDLAGYILKYTGTYNRPIEQSMAIYQADVAELQRIRNKLEG